MPRMAHSLLEGKRAIVTGAAQGLGRAVAMQFALEGATVALFDKSEGVVGTCGELEGHSHKTFVIDVTK
jgi:NAD(P)-dependent dehydrogenase (short-subunit alcohol dehydrogenase family)